MSAIELHGVCKAYKNKPILHNLDLTINAGSFTVIFGGPASGKSVLLRLIMGLEKPDRGQILIRDTDAAHLLPAERNIGYIPQSFALYPHFSVYDNIAYPLTLARMDKASIKARVEDAANRLKISALLGKKPNQLSGGEKQRVAIARGIVKETEIFIFDDPLTGLDFKLREQLFDDFKRLREAMDATFVYTTSDALEALMMADEIAARPTARSSNRARPRMSSTIRCICKPCTTWGSRRPPC
jgi:ABC-type sugar transport system ATPase subunit